MNSKVQAVFLKKVTSQSVFFKRRYFWKQINCKSRIQFTHDLSRLLIHFCYTCMFVLLWAEVGESVGEVSDGMWDAVFSWKIWPFSHLPTAVESSGPAGKEPWQKALHKAFCVFLGDEYSDLVFPKQRSPTPTLPFSAWWIFIRSFAFQIVLT